MYLYNNVGKGGEKYCNEREISGEGDVWMHI